MVTSVVHSHVALVASHPSCLWVRDLAGTCFAGSASPPETTASVISEPWAVCPTAWKQLCTHVEMGYECHIQSYAHSAIITLELCLGYHLIGAPDHEWHT